MKNNLLLRLFLLTISIFTVSFGFSQNCPSGIISLWTLDDASENLFLDKVGNHNASSEASISSVAGKAGSAKYFSGANYLSAADHADFDFNANSSFSVECWVKYSALTGGFSQVFIGKKDQQATGPYWFLGVINSNGKVVWEINDSQGVYKDIYSPTALSLDSWHHLVGIRDKATNTNKLYVDGVMVASITYNYTGNFNSDGPVMMGAFSDNTGIPAYFLTGAVDEAAIYDHALTQEEIAEHIQENNYGMSVCDPYSPVIRSTPVNTAIVGKPYLYTVNASGIPTMAYTLVSGPEGMTIDNATGLISWTPASTEVNAWVEVRASNGVVPADTQKFRIYLAEAPTNCPDNALLMLKLDETSGSAYADYYVDHTATASVAPTPTEGIINGAQAFGATTGIVIPDLGNEFEWDYNDNFSIELWAKTSTFKTMVMIGRRRLAGDYPDKARWWVGTDASGLPMFSLTDNAATPNVVEISGEESIANDNWHHIIAVCNGSAGRMRLYVDGVKVADVAALFDGFIADVPTPVSVGYWYPQYDGQPVNMEYHFTGSLDEVVIFNTAITDAQAASFYNLGAPTGHCAIDNYVPVITSTPVTEATEDAGYSYTFTVEDADASDVIALSAPTKPDWLTFNYTPGQKSATLSGTPSYSNLGDNPLVLQVTDGTVTRNQSFNISVAHVNHDPQITSTPVTDATEDEAYSYTFTVEDVDVSDVITLTAPTKPDWLTFTYTAGQKSATLSGTPTNDHVGDHDVILQVSDGTVTKSQPFTISVANVNDSPVITSTPSLTGYVGDNYSYTLTATDVDANSTLTFIADTKPAWLAFDAVTGILSGTPAQADKGDNPVLLQVTDGIDTVDQSFTIAVGGLDAINDLESAGIGLYPVPAKDHLMITFKDLSEEAQIDVISATGSIVKKSVVHAGQQSYRLDLSGIEAGLYHIHIRNSKLNNISRFIISK